MQSSQSVSQSVSGVLSQAEAVLTAAGELPPQWLDVTAAVRYMVSVTRPPTPQGHNSSLFILMCPCLCAAARL
jgi:hypothetical protein